MSNRRNSGLGECFSLVGAVQVPSAQAQFDATRIPRAENGVCGILYELEQLPFSVSASPIAVLLIGMFANKMRISPVDIDCCPTLIIDCLFQVGIRRGPRLRCNFAIPYSRIFTGPHWPASEAPHRSVKLAPEKHDMALAADWAPATHVFRCSTLGVGLPNMHGASVREAAGPAPQRPQKGLVRIRTERRK